MHGQPEALIGRVLDGRYRIDRKVARGGMASVYQSHDLRLERTVAIKVMHESLAEDAAFVRRFQREARSAARLSDPNVVAVFDTGDDHGTLFMVMEYVPGTTLRDLIAAKAPLSPIEALKLIEPVLTALSAAHKAGIVHRDVKPENVLMADDGRIKVADFGLSRAVNTDTHHTATGGILIGTVSYLSPELVVNGEADPRADVYATGVILYELMTGHKPHTADNPIQVAYKHVHEDIPAPSREDPSIPDYVDALLARATAREMTLRSADASVLLHQVRQVRHALEEGTQSDSELTSDLMPSTRNAPPEGNLPEVIIDPSDFNAGIADELGADELEATADRVFDQDAFDPGAEPTNRIQMPVSSPPPPAAAERPGGRAGPAPASAAPTGPAYAEQPPRPGFPTQQPAAEPAEPLRPASRRGPLLLAGVLLLALFVGAFGWWFGVGRFDTTPSVIGMTPKEATTKLAESDLDFTVVSKDYSEDVPKGEILSTDPEPQGRISRGGTVTATISLGPERYEVPKLVGENIKTAKAIIEDVKLAVGRTKRQYSDEIAKDTVISADPQAGTSLKPGSAVTLVVSKGRKPVDIPDFTEKPLRVAQSQLSELGFEVSTNREFSDSVPKGSIISQSPREGTGFRGDTITLLVSKGSRLVQVPNVIGAGVRSATRTLEEAGFKVKTKDAPYHVGLKYVVGQEPGPGAIVPRGSTITLTIV